MFITDNTRILIRPIDEADANDVVKWRNSREARASFFTSCVVTPDSHLCFLRSRKPHDLVWIIEKKLGIQSYAPEPIGMVSLTVDTTNYQAEFGRLFIDKEYKRQGYAEEAAYMVLYYAFEILRLTHVWADVKGTNTPARALYENIGFIEQLDVTSAHKDAVICKYYRLRWQQVGRDQFAALMGVELPEWEDDNTARDNTVQQARLL